MKQEIVLPKFKLPGQTNWLMRGMWIAGGLIVLLTGLVAWGLVQRQAQEAEARLAAEKQQMQQQLESERAAAQAAAEARKPAPRPDRVAGVPGAATKPTLATARPATPTKLAPARAGHTTRKKPTRNPKMFAAKPAASRRVVRPAAAKPKAGSAKGGDAIDDILRKFK